MIKSTVLATIAVFALAGCPQMSKYDTAHATINFVRIGAAAANSAIVNADATQQQSCNDAICTKLDPAHGTAYATCMGQSHATDPVYIACYKKTGDFVTTWTKSYAVTQSTCTAADSAVDLWQQLDQIKSDKAALEAKCAALDPTKGTVYKQCIASQPIPQVNWTGILQAGACLAYTGLNFVPKDFDTYIAPVRAILKALGSCK